MSIFPFIGEDFQEEGSGEVELPLFREYAYDFEKNELLLDKDGRTYLVEGNEALKIWITKALLTQRYRFNAYSADYGNEAEDALTGSGMDQDILAAELERYVVEALMVNPYIEELGDFEFVFAQGLLITFSCKSIYGRERMEYMVKEVTE